MMGGAEAALVGMFVKRSRDDIIGDVVADGPLPRRTLKLTANRGLIRLLEEQRSDDPHDTRTCQRFALQLFPFPLPCLQLSGYFPDPYPVLPGSFPVLPTGFP
jgi:hypothetical protein